MLFWEDYSIAANLLNRRYVGIDTEQEYLDIAVARKKEIENPQTAELYRSKINGFHNNTELNKYLAEETPAEYEVGLTDPFKVKDNPKLP